MLWLKAHRRMMSCAHMQALRQVENMELMLSQEDPGIKSFYTLAAVIAFGTMQRIEFSQRRLDEEGIVSLRAELVQLDQLSRTWNDELRQNENTTRGIDDALQQLLRSLGGDSRHTAASASVGAAPGAGEAAASGAGQTSTRGSQSRSRSSSSATQVRARRPRKRRPPRKSEPASSSGIQRPQGCEAKPMPKPGEVVAAPRPATAAPAKLELVRTPARGGPPHLKEGAWVHVKDGWLTGRHQPESTWEMMSWGADVVASMYACRDYGDYARGCIEAALSVSALKDHIVCPVHPCRADYSIDDCQHLTQGNRVVVICRRVVQEGGGRHRKGIAIYLLLRLIVGAPDERLDMMEKMHPVMLREFMSRHLYRKGESIL